MRMDGCARGKKAHSSARIRDKFSLLGRGTEPAHALLVSWPGFVIWVRVDHSLIYHEGKYSGRAAPGRCELAAGCRAMRWLSGAGQPRRGLLCAQPRACSLQPMVHSSCFRRIQMTMPAERHFFLFTCPLHLPFYRRVFLSVFEESPASRGSRHQVLLQNS